MKMDRILARSAIAECSTGMRLPEPTPSREWEQADSSAANCLNAGWILPGTKCHPAVEVELAALLSAYGMLPDEIDAAALIERGAA